MNRRPNYRPKQPRILLSTATAAVCATIMASVANAQTTPPTQAPSTGDRVLGLDVSAYQGDLSQSVWNNLHTSSDNRDFAFIRASRGGTTGEDHRQGGYPSGNNTYFNLSERYDDPYFAQNITRATAAGMYAGAYHFSRPDVIASTTNSGGIANTGTDEADHFMQMSGPWMRPGYLIPTHDLEAGDGIRSDNGIAQFAIDFSNRVYAVMGIRPAVYINGNYASSVVGQATNPTPQQVVAVYPTLWTARWPNQTNPNSIPVQTMMPNESFSSLYGPWDDNGNPQPWTFWQYASTAHLPSYSTTANLDVDVAAGNLEFLKDQLIPAIWMNGNSGNWEDKTNWNSGQTAVAPVQGSGQLARVGTLVLPKERLPGQADTNTGITGQDDTVNLNRPNENITVTMSNGTYNMRRLNLNETLVVNGGNLNASLTGWVGAGGTLRLHGGNVTFTDAYVNNVGALDFTGSGNLNVGTLYIASNPSFTGSSGTGQILGKSGVASPSLNLMAGTRTFTVGDGSAATDMRIAIPLTNGNLTKDGDGTLELTGNNSGYTGTLNVARGALSITGNNQIGTTGVTQSQTATNGGVVQLNGNGLNLNKQIILNGAGVAPTSALGGALENVSGNNTWSGAIKLNGTDANINNSGLNQIFAATGTTLNLSGVIQNNTGVATANWAKTGDGDVVLNASSANTYNGLTRLFGGKLIVEKNGALGSAGSDSDASANTFQVGTISGNAVESTLAFRNSVNYSTNEWIFTDGLGIVASDYGQIDSLGGNNIFAGKIGLGGPTVNGTVESYLGVSTGSLELSGPIYAKSQAGPVARNIFKRGAGTLILSGDSSGTPTNNQAGALSGSTFTLNGGVVQLKGTATSSANLPGVSTWKMNTNTTLDIAKSGAAGSADLVLNGGKLSSSLATLTLNNKLATDNSGTGGGVVDVVGGGATLALTGQFDNSAGKTVRKQGAGILNIAGSQSHGSGAAFINEAGTTNFANDAGSLASMNLSVTVNSGTRVNFNAVQHINDLHVQTNATAALSSGNDKLIRTRGLTLDGVGNLDLTNNDLLLDYTGSASPFTRIRDYSVSGYNFGFGLTSSLAVGDTVIAVVDNAEYGLTKWANENIAATTIIGKYTYFGDANLDGKVTAADYLAIDANVGSTNARWFMGDFNLDGKITSADYIAIDANVGKGTSDPLLVQLQQDMIAQHTELFGAEYVDGLAAALDGHFQVVPEPSCLGILAFGGLLAFRRRRPSR